MIAVRPVQLVCSLFVVTSESDTHRDTNLNNSQKAVSCQKIKLLINQKNKLLIRIGPGGPRLLLSWVPYCALYLDFFLVIYCDDF